MEVAVTNRQRTQKINLRLLNQIVDGLLQDMGIDGAELGIHLVGAPEMTRLNGQFLQHQGSTDVITFDYANAGGQCFVTDQKATPSTKHCPPLHGDIFICVDEAVRAAYRFRTNWQSEIVRYLVHGVLHLRGHDDSHPGVRRKMKREEARRLRALSRRFSLAQLAGAAKIAA
jgi:probable rRNA maturation factor